MSYPIQEAAFTVVCLVSVVSAIAATITTYILNRLFYNE